jgi:hypothetical protein
MKNITAKIYKLLDFVFYSSRKRVVPSNSKATTSNPSNPTSTQKITQYLNDPSTPSLTHTEAPRAQMSNFKINVQGYTQPSGKPINSVEWLPENCYANIVNLLTNLKDHLVGKNWAATMTLGVIPRAGNTMNAYYDRSNLKFFYFDHRGKHVETASSADIVCHECGHGILDGLRPDFWNVASIEIPAFHESFGDLMALHAALFYDEVLNIADLNNTTFLSKIGDEFGLAIGTSLGLRDINNNLSYIAPSKLPNQPTVGFPVSTECHDFSRVWSGIYFSILKGMHKQNGETKEGLIISRNYLLEIFMESVKTCPVVASFYSALAKCMVAADAKRGGKYKNLLNSIFVSKNLISANVKMLSTDSGDQKMEVSKNTKMVSLKDLKLDSVLAQSLDDVKILIPSDDVTFDGEIHELSTSEEAINQASVFVDSLIKNGEIGKSWIVNSDNVLERNHISCKHK